MIHHSQAPVEKRGLPFLNWRTSGVSRWIPLMLTLVGCLAGVLGCEPPKRTVPGLAAVSGMVTLDGQPLRGAEVQFYPDNAQRSQGTTDQNGRYVLFYDQDIPGAVVGRHTVVISKMFHDVQTGPRELLPERYSGLSDIRVEVKSGKNDLDFDLQSDPDTETGDTSRQPAATSSRSPAENTTAEAEYTGSKACVDCHESEAVTYRKTGMGQSLAELDADREPPNAEFTHTPSARKYAITRKNGRLHHRETLIAGDAEHLLGDYTANYVVGSGHHSRSYLMELDSFLVESPVTWYRANQTWAMSPGYDQPLHSGFQREVPEKCLFCHAGRAIALDDSLHRIRFLEHAIGCERCHGPGSTHVARQAALDDKSTHPTEGGSREAEVREPETKDDSIVNPAHLTRELADAVCHQCHLTTEAYVSARGRRITDFRPGLPLRDFRHYYRAKNPSTSMRVVGHVDQLMASRCYREAESLTCITCHNPHATPTSDQRMEHYRSACLRCHQPDACRVDPDVLRRRSPPNDCVACHMPTSPTEIPHMAFTHHRIGLHQDVERSPGEVVHESESREAIELEPLYDLSHLSNVERLRSLGLAYSALNNRAANAAIASRYANRATALLRQVRSTGMQDGEVDAALAVLAYPQDPATAVSYATAALNDSSLSAVSRVNSLFAIAAHHFEQERYQEAINVLQQLTRLRRNAADWSLLGQCLLAMRDVSGATSALEKAATIDPNRIENHEMLVDCYERAGKHEQSARSRALAAAVSKAAGQ